MKNLKKIIGITLLFPPILSVVFFTVNVFIKDCGNVFKLFNLSSNWTGDVIVSDNSGAGFSSTITIYFGLMAIAGALLIKDASFNSETQSKKNT